MTKKATNETPLEQLPKEINERLKRADKHQQDATDMRISAGKLLVEAKTKVLAKKADGEDVTWKSWVAEHIERSYGDCNKCIKLLEAPDPAKAREDEKTAAREGMAKNREKPSTSDVDPTEGLKEDDPKKDLTAPNEESSPEKAVKEVDDILTDAEKLDYLKTKIRYWLDHTATLQDLVDLESYMGIPDIPKVEKVSKPKKNKPQPVKEAEENKPQPVKDRSEEVIDNTVKQILKEEGIDTSDIPEATEEDFKKAKLVEPKPKTAEESLKKAAKDLANGKTQTPKIDKAVDEGDDDYVRPGLEGAEDDPLKMPEFLKRG